MDNLISVVFLIWMWTTSTASPITVAPLRFVNLDFTFDHIQNCVVEFRDLSAIFDFSRPNFPRVLYTGTLATSFNANATPEFLVEAKTLPFKTSQACVIRFLSSEQPLAPKQFRSIINKKQWDGSSLYLANHSWDSLLLRRKNFYDDFGDRIFVLVTPAKSFHLQDHLPLFHELNNIWQILPRTALIFLHDHRTLEINGGYTVCTACDDETISLPRFLSFECKSLSADQTPSNCWTEAMTTDAMSTDFGRNVLWNVIFDYTFGKVSHTFPSSPFDRHSKQGHRPGPITASNAAVSLAFAGLNTTFINTLYKSEEYSRVSTAPAIIGVPRKELPSWSYKSCELIPTGTLTPLRFITAAGVIVKSEAWGFHLHPFDNAIWVALASLVCVSVVVRLVARLKFDRNVAFIPTILLEQGDSAIQKPPVWSMASFVMAWMTMGLILTNAYKGSLKSNYASSVRMYKMYNTLQDLLEANITVYASYPKVVCDGLKKTNQYLEVERLEPYCYHKEYRETDACKLILRLHFASVKNLAPDYISLTRVAKMAEHLRWKMKYVCTEDIAELVQKYLSDRKSALVVLEDRLTKIWPEVERISVGKVPLVSNMGENEAVLEEVTGFWVTGGWRHPVVFTRLKIIMQSGLYFLWEEWEQVKEKGWHGLQMGRGAGKDSQRRPVKALRLEDSSMKELFVIYGLGVAVTSICFFMEIIAIVVK